MKDGTVEAGYARWSRTYDGDRNLTRDLDQHAVRTLLAGRRFRSVVEIGCGTGKNTRFLAGIADRVHGVDFSEGMLARARAKGLGGAVSFTRADVTRRWPCADGVADLVTFNLVLEHVEDLGHVFREAARVLAPGGEVLVCELHPFKQYLGSRAKFEGEGLVELPAYVHHVSEFIDAAAGAGLTLVRFKEWWHAEDGQAPPRVASFEFTK